MERLTGKYFCFLCLLGWMAVSVSHAGIVYSAPPNQSGASDANNFLEADEITVGIPTHINLVTFWTFQTVAADYTGSIAWSFRSDALGAPGASLVSGTATPAGGRTFKSAFGLNEFGYTFPIDVTLNPGTYWLVLHNGPNNTIPPTDFFWEWSNGNAGNSVSQDLALPNQPWLGNFSELAFQLENIPEPGSLPLAGAGLLAVWLARNRKYNESN